jgi:hypothetical protein
MQPTPQVCTTHFLLTLGALALIAAIALIVGGVDIQPVRTIRGINLRG